MAIRAIPSRTGQDAAGMHRRVNQDQWITPRKRNTRYWVDSGRRLLALGNLFEHVYPENESLIVNSSHKEVTVNEKWSFAEFQVKFQRGESYLVVSPGKIV